MNRHHSFKYPKLIILALTFVLAYFMLAGSESPHLEYLVESTGYLGIFIIGVLFSYGFTAAPATALFIASSSSYPLIPLILIGGGGALFGNLLFFNLVRSSFSEEILELEHERIIRKIERSIPPKIRHFLVPLLAGFVLASPLPDEVAISIVATSKIISHHRFIIFSYIFHVAGIAAIILIGRAA